ncbi:MAG: membrane-spanning protein [Tissierellia bacterium]|nr:membrane-spanning protein [Tissierellia bacterium]
MENFIITLLIGSLVGVIFYKLKVPGGMMVGAVVGVSIFNILTDIAYMPIEGRIVAQMIAGAFIGSGLEKSDLKRLKNIFKPIATILIALLILNLVVGFIIYYISPMDLVTSFMCAIPGGMNDTPIISGEMGADSAKVAVMQFIRMVFGIGIFPSMISKLSKLEQFKADELENESYERKTIIDNNSKNLILTLLLAITFGTIGRLSGIPAGTLVFSMAGVIGLKLSTNRAYLPKWIRRLAQVLSGTYVGSGIVYNDLLEMKYLVGPAVVLILGYGITCIFVGTFIHKKFSIPIKDSMLACTPAGASDMALIAADIGVKSADVIVIQVIRMVVVISVFPQIISIIASLIG